jgi:hypothetical protein
VKTTTAPKRTLAYLKALRADELSGLRHLPEGSPEREEARKRIAALSEEIKALKA